MWTDCNNARIEREGLVLLKTNIFRGLAAIDESRRGNTINSHIVAAILIKVTPTDSSSSPMEEAILEKHSS